MPERRVLFVCTGNICRSPMAAAVAAARAGDRTAFESAGIRALAGEPATPEAVEACAEAGVALAGHRARAFDRTGSWDRVYVMTADHLRAVLAAAPHLRGRVEMLRPDGGDVDDPYGWGIEAYRRARDEITAAIDARGSGL